MHPKPRTWRALVLTLLLPLLMLGGCATTNPRDPFEPVNRVIYTFNDTLDTAVIRPLAEGYRAVMPSFVRTGISNFFSNINDVLVALNNLLQGKVVAAGTDLARVVINSTVGAGGLMDLASSFGLEKNNEDFGQTLGYWGVGDGPYLMLPFLGPSNLRDTIGRVVESRGDPVGFIHDVRWRNSLWGARTVNQRAELLDTSRLLETASLDPYEFLRDGYLQRRRNLIYDGSPPREKDDDATMVRPRAARPASAFPDDPPPGSVLVSGEGPTPARAAAIATIAAPHAEQQPAAHAVPAAAAPAAAVTAAPEALAATPPTAPATAEAAAQAKPVVSQVWNSAAND